MKKIAIIGYGNFGKLTADILKDNFDIFIYDKNKLEIENSHFKTLNKENISQMNYIIFSVPASFLEASILEWKNYISKNSLVLDVLSVKVFPKKLLKKYFPENEIICTHPLFGPNSVKNKIPNLSVMIENISATEENFISVKTFLENLRFSTIEISSEKHDKKMAYVHVLSHFIGFGLDYVPFSELTTTRTLSFDYMKNLHDNVIQGGEELFLTIQKFNPYAKETREKFIKELTKINKKLNEK